MNQFRQSLEDLFKEAEMKEKMKDVLDYIKSNEVMAMRKAYPEEQPMKPDMASELAGDGTKGFLTIEPERMSMLNGMTLGALRKRDPFENAGMVSMNEIENKQWPETQQVRSWYRQSTNGYSSILPEETIDIPTRKRPVCDVIVDYENNYPNYKLGKLSAEFESHNNPKAISKKWDVKGGPSYGKYQIATKPGTMGDYIKYAKSHEEYKSYGDALAAAGGNRAALIRDPKFVNAWLELSDDPEFIESTRNFLLDKNLCTALKKMNNLNLNLTDRPPAVMDSIFSLAIQNGAIGADRVLQSEFSRDRNLTNLSDEELIKRIYNARSNPHWFIGSQKNVQDNMPKRMRDEKKRALEYLN